MRRVLLACLLAVVAAMAQADEDWSWSGALGLASGYMDYRETGSDGRRLNREHGSLPGIVASLRGQSATWSTGAKLSYFDADVRYEGMTSSGSSITTRTDQRIADGSAWLGLRGFDHPHVTLDWYAGGGLRWWNRDIRSTVSAFGVDEIYSWPYLLAGLQAERKLTGGDSLRLDLRLLRPLDPSLRVDFKNDYDSVEVGQEARAGGRLELVWTRPWNDGRTLSVSAWYEQWRFGAGDTEVLRRNGVPIGSVHEPESKTEFLGVAVTLGGLGF
ncbi:MAG: hypothetical protein OQL11_11720 [Gammaproteobacteria bacterium]|nr:hypothetical protein [Gammaproteobacteria bacterium]